MARSRFYVHPVQKKYAIIVATLLILYSFILATALFFSSIVDKGVISDSAGPWQGPNRFMIFFDNLWPVLVITIPIFVLLSIFTTHRMAGPIHRLKLILGQVLQGDLSPVVKFRSGDEFHDLADLVNKVLEQQRGLLTEMIQGNKELREALDRVASHEAIPPTLRESLVQANQANKKMQKALNQYKLIEKPS